MRKTDVTVTAIYLYKGTQYPRWAKIHPFLGTAFSGAFIFTSSPSMLAQHASVHDVEHSVTVVVMLQEDCVQTY
jgi:hypothetical protein